MWRFEQFNIMVIIPKIFNVWEAAKGMEDILWCIVLGNKTSVLAVCYWGNIQEIASSKSQGCFYYRYFVHDEELSFEEKNAINYIGGYIIKQLHTRVVTRKNFVDALQLLQSDLPTGLESARWTETVDRGGLTHINEMFYLCLVAIEKVYKSCICGCHNYTKIIFFLMI